MMILLFILLSIGIERVYGDIESPCPSQFLFLPEKSESDRWYGVINLQSEIDITSVKLQLYFDKAVIQFGNFLGQVKSNDENTEFTITAPTKLIKAHTTEKVQIFVIYHPVIDVVPPNLSRIVFNGREICPHFEKQEMNIGDENGLSSIVLNILPNCGVTKSATVPLISEGEYTSPGDWPWHTAIYWKDASNPGELRCGGTLISEHHVLTAAHCTTWRSNRNSATDFITKTRDPESIFVVLGKYGTYIQNGSNEQTIEVSKITVHPQYNSSNYLNDISIIHLKRPAQITDFVRYICLWSGDTSLNSVIGEIGVAAGWGRDHKDNEFTDLLMLARMPVVDTITCIRSFPEIFGRYTNENNFCAGFRNGTSVCNGDSGGGLVFPVKGTSGPNTQWQIRGIVSNSVPKAGLKVCDPKYYVIFTDVARYLDWIRNKMKS